MPTDRRAGLRGLGPAFGVVLPRLAAAVGRHVEQAEGPVDRPVATAGGGVSEERAVAVAQETDDVPHVSADRRLQAPHRAAQSAVRCNRLLGTVDSSQRNYHRW